MKSIVESINESLVNEGVEYAATWDLVDMQDMKPKDLKAYLKDDMSLSSKDQKFYTDLIKLVNKNKGKIFTSDEGNLYYDEYGYSSMAAMLVDRDIIEEGSWGFVLNKDGDDDRSTFCVFDKEPNKADWKKICKLISDLNMSSWMHVCEVWEDAGAGDADGIDGHSDEEIRQEAEKNKDDFEEDDDATGLADYLISIMNMDVTTDEQYNHIYDICAKVLRL